MKAYYIKECSYFDQVSATFHTQVLALCPIMERSDDFGDGSTNYPLFWIKYSDLAPFLTKQTIMTSSINNAAVMSVDDYFTKNQYRGEIYKTNNMLGQTLAQYCNAAGSENERSVLTAEQKRIEKEIADFEENMWGDRERKDSLDSIAKLDKSELKRSLRKRNRRAGDTVGKSTVKVKKASKGSTGSSSSSSALVTVRRERH